jgi:hypothetical protein
VSRYYEDLRLQTRPKLVQRTLAAANTFTVAIILLAFSVGLAARMTQRALELQAEQQIPIWHFDQPDVPVDQSVDPRRRSHVESGE